MTESRGPDARQELVKVIRQVRSRWRTTMLLRGGAVIVLGLLVALFVASYGLQSFKFSPGAVIGFRVATFVLLAGLGLWMVVWPLRRQVSDLQVALYVEEHEPSMQAAILSAVDVSTASETRRARRAAGHSRSDGRAGGREGPHDSGRTHGRPEEHAALHDGARGCRGHRPRARDGRPRVHPPGRGGALQADQRRSREPVFHPGEARRHERAEGLGPGGEREARRVPVERRRADGACRRATPPTRGCRSSSPAIPPCSKG